MPCESGQPFRALTRPNKQKEISGDIKMDDTHKKDFLEQVVFPICGVAISVIVLAFGAQLTLTLLNI